MLTEYERMVKYFKSKEFEKNYSRTYLYDKSVCVLFHGNKLIMTFSYEYYRPIIIKDNFYFLDLTVEQSSFSFDITEELMNYFEQQGCLFILDKYNSRELKTVCQVVFPDENAFKKLMEYNDTIVLEQLFGHYLLEMFKCGVLTI